MAAVPTTNWFDKKAGEGFDPATALENAPDGIDFKKKTGQVTHTFTHFHLLLDIYEAASDAPAPTPEGWWSTPRAIKGEALPTVFRKVVEFDA